MPRIRRRDHPNWRPMAQEFKAGIIIVVILAVVLIVAFCLVYRDSYIHLNDHHCDDLHALMYTSEGTVCVPVYAVPPTT